MAWTYDIASRALRRPDGSLAPTVPGLPYCGHDKGRDNLAMVAVAGVGPVPPGRYRIGPAHTSPHTGPITMDLDPEAGTETHGRSLFRIHGDDRAHDASHGCIIAYRVARLEISASADRELIVT